MAHKVSKRVNKRVNRKQNKRLTALETGQATSEKEEISSNRSESAIHARLRKLEEYMEANPIPAVVSVAIDESRLATIEAAAQELANSVIATQKALVSLDVKVATVTSQMTRSELRKILEL